MTQQENSSGQEEKDLRSLILLDHHMISKLLKDIMKH